MTRNYLRYPDIKGDDLVFVADNDVWIAPVTGGRASRLTSDRATAKFPVLSPDGTKVAWTSTKEGAPDVYVLDLESGEQHRLTYWANRAVATVGWLGDRVLVCSAHDQMDATTRPRIRAVSLDGSVETLDTGLAMSYAEHPSGVRAISTPNHRDPSQWKRYRGGTASRIWIDNGGWQRILPEIDAGLHGTTFVGDRLVFSSDLEASIEENADGQSQIHSVNLDGTDLQQHTHHTPAEGYVRDPRSDGERIVYHAHGVIYFMDSLDSEPRAIDIALPGVHAKPLEITSDDQLDAFVPDRAGNGSVLSWRGAAWYLTHRGGPARALSSKDGVRIREPQLLGNDRAVWASDVEGEDCLEIMPITGGNSHRIAQGQLGRVLHLAGSHDGKTIATISHDGRISLVDAESGSVREIDRSRGGEATDISFSPDDRYIAWRAGSGDDGERGMLRAAEVASGTVLELTDGTFDDRSPVFTSDGKYLAFFSRRTFDPSYDELGFDLSFVDTTRPWLVPLRADEPAPFGVAADGWPVAEIAADEEPIRPEADESASDDKAKDEPKIVTRIDFDGFEHRAIPFPVAAGEYSDLTAVADGLVWIRHQHPGHEIGTAAGPDKARDRLEHYSFGKRKLSTIADRVDGVAASGDGKQLVVWHDEDVWVQPSDRRVDEDDDARIDVDTSRLHRRIDPHAEWREMFDDNGRLMRDFYWREDMDGVDWDAVLARYRPLIDACATHDDLVDLLWEVVAELNTSHAYVQPRGSSGPRQGFLGAEFRPTSEGAEIVRILPGESSDPAARSPLLAAGVDARAGDVIVAIGGRSVVEAGGVGPLLVDTARKAVELTIRRDGKDRRVAVVPIASEEALRYHEWTTKRRDYVEKQSGGKLGYVHIPDMISTGWAQFYRMIDRATKKDGVVVDVRYNHGGHTSSLIIERLARRVLHWGGVRQLDEVTPYPPQAIRGPVVLVTNQWAGSDGDIVSASAQVLGIGPIVGERSWGGVYGIDGRFDLVDGTGVTEPRYWFYSTKHGWSIENHGIDPDIEVVMSPADFNGEDEKDAQLDAAIEAALESLREHPAATPPELAPPRAHRK